MAQQNVNRIIVDVNSGTDIIILGHDSLLLAIPATVPWNTGKLIASTFCERRRIEKTFHSNQCLDEEDFG